MRREGKREGGEVGRGKDDGERVRRRETVHHRLYSPPLLSSHLTILSQLIRELLILFFQSQLEAPVSSNHQEPGRLQEAEGREEKRENCRERRERRKDTDRGGRGGLTEFSQHW